MTHKKKIGDLFGIKLLNNNYAFGRLFLDGSVVFYKHRSYDINDLPKTENYKIYDYGIIRPSTKEECEDLEVCAVWEEEHLIERLTIKDDSWKKWFPRFY